MDHTTENEDELFRLSQLGEWGTCAKGSVGEGDPAAHLRPLLVVVQRGVKWTGCNFGLGTSPSGLTPSSTAY